MRIALAVRFGNIALAITAITLSIPAKALPGDYPYPTGYEDGAYNRNGW